ncbi:leucine-rich repeat domain-containing protein [Rickettsia endosymbiont of Ceutorhynchus obstrictus]|uniref:leucine-rich repeat domain-containing protein n=1 Tax=Rickettsia endosymbiont of Ceutorhynchus obstrictus TaxID=3066249 RepID=UPI003132B632
MKELIEFLEKKGFKQQADSLRNGATTLNLHDNNIGEGGAKELAEALKSNNSLTSFSLSSNNIGEGGAKELAEALKSNNSLTRLDLSSNNIGEGGAKELAAALKSNNSLTSLYLWENKIGEGGAKELAAALESNNSLTYLDLRGNKIGEGGAKELAEALKSNNSLTSLTLYSNNIGEGGAKELAAALKSNNSLTSLYLESNNIGDVGAKELAAALKSNNSLTSLDLSSNNIGDVGAKELAAALKSNNSLTFLNLQYNRIDQGGANELAVALKSNNSMTSLYLYSGNNISDAGIAGYLQRNKTIAEKKAESLNAEGNNLCSQEKYNEAIEKYKAAIKITKEFLHKENKLYEKNKINAKKKYEEQQQSLKLKQAASVANENKPADIKDLYKEAEKQDIVQENLKDTLAIFQKILVETTDKLKSTIAISAKDKVLMQNSINEITRTVKTFTNKDDIYTITKSMKELVSGKITKARIAVVEEDLTEIIEQQVKLEEHIRTEKLVIFQKVVADITIKTESNTTISVQDKDIIQNSVKRIIDKVQRLANKTDIETITESTKEIVSSKITKARLGVIEEEVDQLIEQQNKPSHDIIVNKVEVIYDKPLLNHPELLKTALSKFGIQEIAELNNKLSPNLVQEAINNNDDELILAGLVSLGNAEAPAG